VGVETAIPSPILDFTAAVIPAVPIVQCKGDRGVTGDLVDASELDPDPDFEVGDVGEGDIRVCGTGKRLSVFVWA
jgi:hypothetical protein